MLIVLPPSESKAVPRRGRPLDLGLVAFPGLRPAREQVLAALVALAGRTDAARVLGLGETQAGLVDLDRRLATSPAARAGAGLHRRLVRRALGLATLSPTSRRRASARLTIVSSLFGLLRPSDRIPAYRLAGDVSLPGLGAVAGIWRPALDPVVRGALGTGLLVDLRSTTYAAFWRPAADLAPRVATIRVLHETDGRRRVVSHAQLGHQGSAGPGAARGRPDPPDPSRTGRGAPRPRLEGRAGGSRARGHPP